MIGIPIGLLYANAFEWFVHKHVLHGRGKNKKSLWSFHFHEHHNASRKADMLDEDYLNPLFSQWDPQTKEVVGLLAGALAHAPLFPVAPFFTMTVYWSALNYYRVHKRAHLDPDWAKEHLAHHWDHHMGPDQDKNWCVTHPFFDHVMRTRERYLNTDAEREQREKRAKLRQRRETKTETAPPSGQASADPKSERAQAA